jgi:hypothetical protein
MSYTRVKLANIPALTLYNDEPALSRRGQPIHQLICKGKPCRLFTPDVIRCVNLGGEGKDVDWKVCLFTAILCRWQPPSWQSAQCETDLPESLRLGRVQVSCEGWSGPGDTYVLKGTQKLADAFLLPISQPSNCRIMLPGISPSGSTEHLEDLSFPSRARVVVVHSYVLLC